MGNTAGRDKGRHMSGEDSGPQMATPRVDDIYGGDLDDSGEFSRASFKVSSLCHPFDRDHSHNACLYTSLTFFNPCTAESFVSIFHLTLELLSSNCMLQMSKN